MTQQQEAFAREYCVDMNGAAAARRAGYNPANAKQTAYVLLRDPEIRARVDELLGIRETVSVPEVVRELKKVAFGPGSDESGAKVKLASKLKALELLGKHLGAFDNTGTQQPEPVTILEDIGENAEC